MGRKLADLWEYADRSDKSFKCRFCLKDLPGGVVRLRYHLSGVKGGGIQQCSKASDVAKNAALSSLHAVNKKRKTGPGSSNSYGGSSDICDPNGNRVVGYLVANFFEMADIDYKMVESSSFINLVNHLSPGSTLPSSLELQRKLIPSFKVEVEQYVSGAKQSWRETGCTLIPKFELNEKGGRSFLSIFGCSRDRTVLLNTFEVPTNVDSIAPFLEETVRSIVQSVGSHNIVQCVVDGSDCGDYFSSFLGSQFPHVFLSKCAARELQLLFEEIFRDIAWVGNTFTIIKSIVDYICSDTAILSLMRKHANGKELKQQLGVFNLLSSYEMLESILKVKEDLVQLVRSPEWLASGYGTGQRGIEVTAYIEDSKTWELGEKVKEGLRSLFQVLCYVDFHDSGSGYLYGLMEIVEHSIDQDMYQTLWGIFISKKEEILSEFHSAAAFLNPAYMFTKQAKDFDSTHVKNYILGRFIAEGDRQDFIKEVDKYKEILSNKPLYESTVAETYHHPCKWWESCGEKLPILRNLATRVLSQPCSTSTCTRSMCTVEAVHIKEYRELARGIMTDLDLHMNAILMERFDKDKACHEREKIVLEEFSKPGSNNGESTSRAWQELELCFMTDIESHVCTNRFVEGKNKHQIHVCLRDLVTKDVVTEGIPSTLHLITAVVDGNFSTEASTDGHTRDFYNRNELSDGCPYITGNLGVALSRGEGTLGKFSFNYSSVNTESGRCRLAVKTLTGFCEGYRIREGISNDFIVEDAEEEESLEQLMAHVDHPQNGSFPSNPGQNSFDTNCLLTETHEYFSLHCFNTPNDPPQGNYQSLAQRTARRVKKKALDWHLRSRGRKVTLKRGFQSLAGKRRGTPSFES